MFTNRLQRTGIIVLVLTVIAAPFALYWFMRRWNRRRALDLTQDRHRSGQALIRYIQMHNQCSEEEAYQRLAAFVNRHAPFYEQSSIKYMLSYGRQGLLELAQRILIYDPDEIDEL